MVGLNLSGDAAPPTLAEFLPHSPSRWKTPRDYSVSRVFRYTSIDILRGMAVLLMIQGHFVENLAFRQAAFGWLYDVCQWLSAVPAPLFTFASGFSFSLWVRKQRMNRICETEITRVAVRRGLFLIGLGFAFNVFVWLPEDTFNWDILTFIGVALLVLTFARSLPPGVLLCICPAVLLLGPPLRMISDYAAYWEGGSYEYDFKLRDVAFGFFLNGYFPFFPWIVFSVTGFVLSETVETHRSRTGAKASLLLTIARPLLIAVAMMVFAGLGDPLSGSVISKHYFNGISMFPASTQYVIGMLGFSIFSFCILHYMIDRRGSVPANAVRSDVLLRGITRFSVFSLTVYILHHIVHLWPLWCFGVWNGQDDPTFYWRNAVSTATAFGLSILCVVVFNFGLVVLERHPKYSFEAIMRWLCD